MTLPCRQEAHILHVWPTLPLTKDHMILSCEQYCQWCPHAIPKRWGVAANLRKHAKCHLQKDSQFSIQAAGRGGRAHLSTQDGLIDPQALFQIHNYGDTGPSSTEPVANQASPSQATPIALPPQGLVAIQSQTDQSPAAASISPLSPLPKSPRKMICPLLLPKKTPAEVRSNTPPALKEGQIATIPKSR